MDLATVPVELLEQLQHCRSAAEALDTFEQWMARVSKARTASIELFDTHEADRRSRRRGLDRRGSEGLHSSVAGLRLPILIAGETVGAVVFVQREACPIAPDDVEAVRPTVALLGTHLASHRIGLRAGALETTDELTGALARSAILRELTDRTTDTADQLRVGTLYIDLDGFKLVNDTYGHAAGDLVLKTIVARFTAELRAEDKLGRLGGDEFLVIAAPGTDESNLMTMASRLRDASTAPIDIGSTTVTVGSSIGASFTRTQHSPPTTPTDLLVEADLAMYQAKRSTTSIVLADESIGRHAELIAMVDRELEAAIADGALFFEYQPIRSLASMEILAVEGYVRWHHHRHGLVPARLIVERMDRLGLVPTFTDWSLNTVGDDLNALRQLAPDFWDKSTSVNLTAHQLAWSGYLGAHEAMLDRTGLRHVDVVVDVVDSGVIEVGTVAQNALAILHNRGTIVSLDDFGTSHNVLGYFTQFPVNSIKFDRSLVESLPKSERVRSVVRGLSQVAHELGIYTLAEGIESQEQLDICLELGIVKGEGHHLGRPMRLQQIAAVVNREHGITEHRNHWFRPD